jgi:hypothetical protein
MAAFVDASLRSPLDHERLDLQIIVSMARWTIQLGLRAYGDRTSWNRERIRVCAIRLSGASWRASKDRTRSGVPVEREL